MSTQVVFSCEAIVRLFDQSRNQYTVAANGVSLIQIISSERRIGLKPVQKLLAFELGPRPPRQPFLEIDLGSNVILDQSNDPALNCIRVVTSHGIEDYWFQTVGHRDEILEFSRWLLKLTDARGIPQHQDGFQQSNKVHTTPSSNPLNQYDYLWMQENRTFMHPGRTPTSPRHYDHLQHAMQQGNFEGDAFRADTYLENFKEKSEENLYESIAPLPQVDAPAQVAERKIPELPPRPENLAAPKSTTKTVKDPKKAPANGPELNATNDSSVPPKPVKENLDEVKNPPDAEKASEGTKGKLCEMLEEAINVGDEKKASEIASALAKKKAKVTVREVVDENDKKFVDATINVTVQVEDKQSKPPTLIKLNVNPNITDVGTLKKIIHNKYSIPIEVQRWVIGKRLPKDNDILQKLEVKTTGTVIFLYLLSAKEVGIKNGQNGLPRNGQFGQKMPSLPLRDYKRGENNGVEPLDARLHGYATTPVVQWSGHDYNRPNFMAPQQPQNDSHRGDYVDFEDNRPVYIPPSGFATQGEVVGAGGRSHAFPIPPQRPAKVEGWKCEACTYINIPTRPGCEVCASSRPADYKMPANFQLDEGEMHRLQQEAFQDQLAHNYEERQKEIQRDNAMQNFFQTLEIAQQALIPNTEPFECPICFDNIEINEGIMLRECLHKICRPCLAGHVKACEDPEIACPWSNGEINCKEIVTAQEIQALLSEEEYMRYLQLSVNAAENRAANSFHCKTTNCIGWCIYEDEVNWFMCEVCGKRNCLTCKAIHDDMTCKEYQDDLNRRAENDEAAKKTQEMLEGLVRKGDAMKCPQCAVILQKKDGCDWMRCSMCRTEICWATKGRRWGPKGNGDISGGCKCSPAKRCHPNCGNCH